MCLCKNSAGQSDLLSGHGEGRVEPLLKRAAALEDGGQQEVEQRPELRKLVLQRRPGQQHAPRRQVMRVQHLRQLTVMVLHAMAFVHDHVLPANLCQETGARERGQRSQVTTRRRTRYLGQHMLVFDDVFVGGDQHVELAAAQLRDEGSSSSRRPLNTHTIT